MKCISCGVTPEDIVGAPDAVDHFIEISPGDIRCTTCIVAQAPGRDSSWLTGILAGLNRRKRTPRPGLYWPVSAPDPH